MLTPAHLPRHTTSDHGAWPQWRWLATVGLAWSLTACGGGGQGDAVHANPQSLSVDAMPSMQQGQTASIRASASSGLRVSYTSQSPQVCRISDSGMVMALATGTCVITLSQAGDENHAPAASVTLRFQVDVNPQQTLSFDSAPELVLGGTATVMAKASSGLAVAYSSQTPTVCDVDAASGLVTSAGPGECIIAADQAGDATYLPAPQARLTLPVVEPPGMTLPAAPSGVSVTAADAQGAVTVSASSTGSGGSPITHYTIRSTSGAVSQVVPALPATVACGGACQGLAFKVSASNVLGEGPASIATHIVTLYEVIETFHEPDTQPRDTVFKGTFVLDATTGEVSSLQGTLTESMTGDLSLPAPDYGMTLLSLNQQLSVIQDDALGGVLVTTFLLPTKDTFTTRFGGDGWSPGAGFGLYAGFPSAKNPAAGGVGNAYVRIFVNLANPTASPTQAQIDKLAYADCTAGGMMGATCMTGTTVAGYGSLGTMSGYPVSIVIRKAR